jgi:DNA-directed RNA polymerase specialized sigma24 family protein
MPSAIEQELAELGDLRQSLRAQQDGLRTQTRFAVLAAYDTGMGVTKIAQLTGLTRRAVYDLLDEAEESVGK